MARLENEALSDMYDLNETWNSEWDNMSEEDRKKDPKYNANGKKQNLLL